MPMPTDGDTRPHFEVVKDSFWSTDSQRTDSGANAPFEGDKEVYQTLFKDNSECEGILISPLSILRICVEKAEAAWSTINFELTHRAVRHMIPG